MLNLQHSDFSAMLPGKVGAVRKICVLIERLKIRLSSTTSMATQAIHSGMMALLSTDEMSIGGANDYTNMDDSFSSSYSMASSSLTNDSSFNNGSPAVHSTPKSATAPLRGMSLPSYSARIKDILSRGKILEDLDLFIEETAYHVIREGDIKSKAEYMDFGQHLLTQYPCLAFPGKKTNFVSVKFSPSPQILIIINSIEFYI